MLSQPMCGQPMRTQFMRTVCALVVALIVPGLVPCQGAPSGEKELRMRFGLLATRAVANFRAADSIEDRLRNKGAVLHPQLTALRLRIEAALDEAQAALDKSDAGTAGEAISRGEVLLDRFARKIGGE
jgi:hypothetical protein